MYKKLSIAIMIMMLVMATRAFALESTKATNINILVSNVFSMEFYTDNNVIYRDTVPFTNIDPNKSLVYPDGRSENDGKSDTAIVCRSNAGAAWFFKIHVVANPPLTADKIKYYVSQPYDRNTGGQSDGSLTQSAQWYPMSDKPTTIFTSGAHDQSNLPFGTLIAFNFAINPSGLNTGAAYSASVIYSMTTSP